jgi:hypothetical protein
LPAELWCRLEQVDPVSAFRGDARRLHSRGPAANDDHVFNLTGGCFDNLRQHGLAA